jgi:hypothetical protein
MNAILFLSLAGLSVGQAPAPLLVRDAEVDRGEVKAGTALTHVFELRNAGPAPLTITEVAVACGCLQPKLSRREIPPGEMAGLAIDVNTLSQQSGPNLWKTTVRFAQGNEKGELELRIKARIVREVSIEPVALGVTIAKESSHTFTLTDRRPKALTIVAVRCSSPEVKVEPAPAVANASGEHTQQVLVTILASFPAGRHTETIQIITDDPEYRELRVPLTVDRRAADQLQATPERVDLRLARGQTSASLLVRLRCNDEQPVVVERMEADQPVIRCKWAEGPGPMATLRIGVESNGRSGQGQVRVHIKGPTPRVLTLPVTWQVP